MNDSRQLSKYNSGYRAGGEKSLGYINWKELDETKGKCFFLYQVIKSVIPRNFNVFLNNYII